MSGRPPVPAVPWPDVAWYAARSWAPFQRNTHHAVLGTSGAGKSHLIRALLAALGPAVVAVILDLKPDGDRVWRGLGNHVGPADLPAALTWRDGSATWHVSAPGGLTAAEVRAVCELVAAERSAVLVLDDATTVTDSQGERGGMGLGGLVDAMLREGRTNALSVVLGLNSPTWAGRGGAKTLCGTYWIGQTIGKEQRDGFAALAGLPPRGRAALDPPHMAPHRWLYSAVDDSGLQALALTTAPALDQARSAA